MVRETVGVQQPNASYVRQRQRVSVTQTKAAPSKAIPVVDAGDTRPSGWRVELLRRLTARRSSRW